MIQVVGRAVRTTAVVAAAAAMSASVLAGCSGPAATPAETKVDVTLQEWNIGPSAASVAAGTVTFTATNTGPEDEHELVIIRTELGARDLPTKADGAVDEEGAGIEALGEIEEFAVSGTESITIDLAAGNYVLICNIVDAEGDAHYQMGMSTAFTVK